MSALQQAQALPLPSQQRLQELRQATKFLDDNKPDEAWDIINAILMSEPDDPRALMVGARIQERARRYAVAYSLAERAVHIAPNIHDVWFLYGRTCDLLYRMETAEMAYRKALALARNDGQRATTYMNMGGMYLTKGMWAEAEEYSRMALKLLPDAWKAKGNLGMACLAQRKWVDGWAGYRAVLGSEARKFFQYGDEPEWDGTPGKTVVLYGEQGIGDEISFASMVPDALRDCRKVIIDCDPRLANLFRRSFPRATVYGTRYAREDDGVHWATADSTFDASLTLGGLGALYRKTDADFPATPYLVPDPERVGMWKSHFDAQRPAIGIAWSGGMQHTASQFRRWTMEELRDLLTVPAHWVSLQYKDASAEIAGTPIRQYAYGTLTKDYDDTAALVSALDLVVCMQTAVAELCGAIGKECWVFIPTFSQWRYGTGDTLPWYKSVKVFRQRPDGSWPLDEARKLLMLRYGKYAK